MKSLFILFLIIGFLFVSNFIIHGDGIIKQRVYVSVVNKANQEPIKDAQVTFYMGREKRNFDAGYEHSLSQYPGEGERTKFTKHQGIVIYKVTFPAAFYLLRTDLLDGFVIVVEKDGFASKEIINDEGKTKKLIKKSKDQGIKIMIELEKQGASE